MGAVSNSSRKQWLLAYDIRDPKRLIRIHRYLRELGVHLQYSVFGLEMSDRKLQDVLGNLNLMIDPARDDIRVYHIPRRCTVWLLGRQSMPEGIELHSSAVMALLAGNRKGSASTPNKSSAKANASDCFESLSSDERATPKPRTRGD